MSIVSNKIYKLFGELKSNQSIYLEFDSGLVGYLLQIKNNFWLIQDLEGYIFSVDPNQITLSSFKIIDWNPSSQIEYPTLDLIKSSKESVAILLLGGTILSESNFSQHNSQPIKNPEKLFSRDFRIISYSNKLSSELNFSDFNEIIGLLKDLEKQYLKIIIFTGTDTLSYLVSYLFYNFNTISSVFVLSSQKTLDKPSTEINSFFTFLDCLDSKILYPGIFFGGISSDRSNLFLYSGLDSFKYSSEQRDAISSNYKPIYSFNILTTKIIFNEGLIRRINHFKVYFFKKPFLSQQVSPPEIIYITPFLTNSSFDKILQLSNRIILIAFGLGNMPLWVIDKIINSPTKRFYIVSQSTFGGINPSIYKSNHKLFNLFYSTYFSLPSIYSFILTITKLNLSLDEEKRLFKIKNEI